MRFHFIAGLVLCLVTFVGPTLAFDVEEDVFFPVDEPAATITIISTADRVLFAPIIKAFQTQNPNIAVRYIIAGSSEIMAAIVDEGEVFDLVVSSAMDLQTKLANDGFARSYQSDVTANLPSWGKWRDSVFAFTQEPAAIVLSAKEFEGQEVPTSRETLLEHLRKNPDRYQDRIGTYDIRVSGLGYLFATQDSRTSDTYWRFIEVLGNFGTRLYSASSSMIDDVVSGEIAVAYNVLGSYASARLDVADDIIIIEPQDFTTVMLRSALLMDGGARTQEAEMFLDFLLGMAWQVESSDSFLFPNNAVSGSDQSSHFRPIKLGPGLLVHLDRLKRARFIKDWEASLIR